MNIKDAKRQVKDTVKAYLAKDEVGQHKIPLSKQRPLFLLGAPGIGKTAIMAQVAQEMGIGLVAYSMTHHTRQSALGLPKIVHRTYKDTEYDASEYTLSEIVASVYDFMSETGLESGILFLDEINCVSETLYPSMLQFLQFKTFGTHRIPDDWVVVCAGNPPEYNKSVHDFDIVTLDRLRKIVVEPDLDAWREYAIDNGIHPAVLSFLDIKKNRFYSVESTPEGKEFITARGWEDLSQTMKVFDEMGIPVERQLIEQFIQKEDIAEDFALYYELFMKYESDYQVESILKGDVSEDIYQRARISQFDERIALISLLVDKIAHECHAVLEEEACVSIVRDRIRNIKDALCEGASVELTLKAELDELKASLAVRSDNATMSQDDIRIGRMAVSKLNDLYKLCIKEHALEGSKAFDAIQEGYKQSVADLEAHVKEAQRSIDMAFEFLDEVFGNDRESTIFVTELTARKDTARMITKFGSDSYYAHNEGIMVDDMRDTLFDRIDALLENEALA